MGLYDDYEMTIGIECHVQLATKTKLFSRSNNDARDAGANTKVSAVDFAVPGTLPVLNQQAIILAIKAGKALNAEIASFSSFDRKHYFYPDLPKGYQTTQMYHPIIGSGWIDVPLGKGESAKVRIHHAHLEEDAGKLTHYSDFSLVDLNRAGTPLIEIVSEPDIHSAKVARGYAEELHRLMVYAGVSNGDLYYGNMRFDVNVSVAKNGSSVLGTRAEVKNLNSFRSVEKAAEYEFKRQVDLIESGGVVVQETRGWLEDSQTTVGQRSKEDALDYRYMPDADIPPVKLSAAEVAEIQATVPALPAEYRLRWQELSLADSVINTALAHQPVAIVLDAIIDEQGCGRIVERVFNWFASVQASDIDISCLVSGLVGPRRLIELSQMVEANQLSSTGAKEIFIALFDEVNLGKLPIEIAKEHNLLQVSDNDTIAAIVDQVLNDPASAASIADIKAGKDKAIGFLVGQVMKRSKGQANPSLAQKLIQERL